MVFKLPYWTHSAIVFDKCHNKMDFVDPLTLLCEFLIGIMHHKDKLSPLLQEHGSFYLIFHAPFLISVRLSVCLSAQN